MKKRGSLVFALCAMVGAFTLACSDDSGNSGGVNPSNGLKVTPTNVELNQGGSEPITMTYNKRSTLVVTSADANCVTVEGQSNQEVALTDNDTATVNLVGAGQGCSTVVSVVDKDDHNVSQNVNVKVAAPGEEVPVLTLSKDSMTLASEGSDTAIATYMLGSTPISQKSLSLSSDNTACANVENSVETDGTGNANIVVTAANTTNNCNATITVHPTAGGTDKTIAVSVTGTGGEGPGPIVDVVGTLAFDKDSITIRPENTDNVNLS